MDTTKKQTGMQDEFAAKTRSGMAVLILNILLEIVCTAVFVIGTIWVSQNENLIVVGIIMIVVGAPVGFIISPILFGGLKIVKPNEAMVLTLFGRYIGTVRKEGFYFVNPFASSVAPANEKGTSTGAMVTNATSPVIKAGLQVQGTNISFAKKRVSMKTMTLSNDKQKINDLLGNPIIIGIVVIWRVRNTYQAVFNVENYYEFLSIQCDSALRNIVRLYPYDANDDESGNEKSLRGSSQEIAEKLRQEIQSKVEVAGLEIVEARITHLAYAPEIAAAMLQRQQASAVVDARQLIVDGAVGMVEMALEKLNEHNVVQLDEERKAAMVSNLLVVLCGNKDAQPIVNSGSIY